jgi:protein TonB
MKRSKRQEQQVQALPGAPAPGTMRFKPQQLQDGEVHGGVIAGIIAAVPSLPPPPPPPPSAEPVEQSYASKQIRIAGNLQSSRLIEKPEPEYPALARQARIQGTVRFNATITKDGTVGNLSLVSGHPLLVTAATEAVRRYRYEPTLLNGEPVEVLTQIDVSFTLGPQ